jgi:hypothetical protein
MAEQEQNIPDDIADKVREIGRAEWGQTPAHDADGHAAHVAESVNKTAEHFGQDGPQHMQGLYIEGTETVICHTGTSPNSAQIACALTGAWNWLYDQVSTPAPVNADKAVEDQDHDDKLWRVLDDVQRALGKGINGRTLAISALRTHFPAPDKALMPEAAVGERAFQIGDEVRVQHDADKPWTADWQEPYATWIVAGVTVDRKGELNFWLLDKCDWTARKFQGGADGFTTSDLILTTPTPVEEPEKGAAGELDVQALASVIHDGRFDQGRQASTWTPFEEEYHSGKVYCLRIANAVAMHLTKTAATNAGQVEAGGFNGMTDDEQPEIPLYDHHLAVRVVLSQPVPLTDELRESIADAVHGCFPVCEDGDTFVEASEAVQS